jgi:LPXTG-motif cell wall-anchored protein
VKNVRKAIAAASISTMAIIGFAGVAGAVDYTPTSVDDATLSQADPVAVSSAGTLPYTGNDSTRTLAEVGVGLLAAGGIATVMVRRRNAQSA